MGWILKTANAIRNKKAPKRLMRAETPMSCRVAIVDKLEREREERWVLMESGVKEKERE
jgi:hypothetical protein